MVEVDGAGRNEEVVMNQIDDAIGKIRGEVRAIVNAAIFAQAPRDIDTREALGERELYVGIRFVIAQQNVEARFFLLDEMVLKRERFLIVGDDDVIDIDGLANQRAGFCVFPASLMKIRGDAGAQVLRLADIDDLALGVFVEVHAGGGGNGTNFGLEIH